LIRKQICRIHYAWIVLGVTFVSLISTASVRSVSGIIIQPLEQEFGWSREQITLAISINMLLFGLAGPFLGRMTDSFGPRAIAIAAMSLISLGVTGTLWMTQAWHFFLLWGVVVGTGSAGTSMVLASTIVSRWFQQRRGLALGILGAAMSAGQLIFTQLIMHLNTDFGWRAATLFAAVVIGCVALPLVLFLMVDSPAQKRLKPYGETGLSPLQTNPSPHPMQIPLRSSGFWLLTLSFGICGLTTSGLIQTHMIPHGLEHGFSGNTMALSLGVMGATDIIGTIASGWICDRFGALRPLAVYYLLRGASLLILPYINSRDDLMIFSVIYGLNWLSTVPATSMLAANMFGKQNVGVVFGWIFFAHQLGAAIASYGPSIIHSLAGDYAITFTVAGAFAVLSTGLVLCIRPDEINKATIERHPEAGQKISTFNFTLHHASLIVADTDVSLRFYCDILGLQQTDRPDLGFPGIWLQLGDQQIHLLQLENHDPITGRPEHSGHDRHIALSVPELSPVQDILDKSRIAYTLSRPGRNALFCRDPDGNALEILQLIK